MATERPLDRFRDALIARDCAIAYERPSGLRAQCPAHEDEHPSLDVDEGLDGRVLVRCRRGCRTEAVVSALNLSMRDLFAGPSQERWRRPNLSRPRRAEISPDHARVSWVLDKLDRAGGSWQVSIGFRCPCCGAAGAWARGHGTGPIIIDCAEGCPERAIVHHLDRLAVPS